MRIFVDRLTLPLWLRLARRRVADISYLEATATARVMSRAGALAGIETKPMRFRMIDVRDEKGLLLRYRISYGDLNEVQEEVLADASFNAWIERHGGGRLAPFLAKKAATSSVTNHERLWRGLYFVQVCAWLLRQNAAGGEAELLIERSPWTAIVIRYAARFGLRAREGSARNLAVNLRETATAAVGARGLGFWLRLVRAHGLSGAASVLARREPPPARRPARWATDYWGHLNLDQPELQSDLFYWQDSALHGAPGLLVFLTPSDPLTAERLETLRARGLDGLAAAPSAAAAPSLPIFRPTRAPAARAYGRLPDGPIGPWLARATRDYDKLRAFWSELFDREGVRLFTTWYKNDATHMAIADAMRDVGGVSAVYQRSYESLPTWALTCDTDVHFSYSPAQAALYRADGSRMRYHVATGFLGDHRFAALREPARLLRERLKRAGAERVIALYDEGSLDDARWHLGHERHRENYRFLLEKALSDGRLGLIVKPKGPKTLRRRLGALAPLLERAEATGRCFVFEGGTIQSSHCPAAAALAADLAVHGHLGAGTAALEAALAGTPTVMLDLEGWTLSPLYRLGVGRCVFTDWDSLWTAASEHWRRPGGVPGFGDWTPMLAELDPFRDGRAARRMGDYLAWLRDGLDAGLGRERAMSDAAERYAKAWGAWTIEEIPGPPWLRANEPAGSRA